MRTHRRARALLHAFHHVRGGFQCVRVTCVRATTASCRRASCTIAFTQTSAHAAPPRSQAAPARPRPRRRRGAGPSPRRLVFGPLLGRSGPARARASALGRTDPGITDDLPRSASPSRPRSLRVRSRPASERAVRWPPSVFESLSRRNFPIFGEIAAAGPSFEGGGHILSARLETDCRRREHPVRDSNP